MIYVHKLLPILLSPIFLIVVLAAWGGLRRSRVTCLVAAALLYALSTPWLSNGFFRFVEQQAVRQDPADQPRAAAIVVLSGMLNDVAATRGTAVEWADPDRFFGGIELYKAGKADTLVFTRGVLPWSATGLAEGEYLREYAIGLGVPAGAIRLTGDARNTAEEARAARTLLADSGKTVLLVTSAYHMPRARVLFEREGFRVTPYPVDFKVAVEKPTPMDFLPDARALWRVDIGVRELIGRLYYSLFTLS